MIFTAQNYKGEGIRGHYALVAYYNQHCLNRVAPSRKYRMTVNDNWCAMFTSCIADMCGIATDAFPYEVSVAEQVKLCKQRGWFFEDSNLATINDLAFFDWKGNGTFAHVGLVLSNDGRNVVTIEGNHNGDVALRTLPTTSKFFAGFASTPCKANEK